MNSPRKEYEQEKDTIDKVDGWFLKAAERVIKAWLGSSGFKPLAQLSQF